MDLETVEPVADSAAGRRRLIGMAGVAGLAGAAAALLAGPRVLAGAGIDEEQTEQPNVPTPADKTLLAGALGLELAARDLYEAQLESSSTGDLAVAVRVMAENHEAYAQAIAGATGISAADAARNNDVYDDAISDFTGSGFVEAAHTLEQAAVATHTALIGEYESLDAIALTTSIVVVESRHATVLADVLGVDDLDVLFGNDRGPLELTGGDT